MLALGRGRWAVSQKCIDHPIQSAKVPPTEPTIVRDKTLLCIVRNGDMKSEVVLNIDVSMTQPSQMASSKRQRVMLN